MVSIGSKVKIPAGTMIYSQGERSKRTTDSVVTVREIEKTKTGNTRVIWKSMGYRTSAVLKNV